MSEIEDWIERQVEAGYSPQEIKDSLRDSGRDPALVDEVLGKRGDNGKGRKRLLIASGAGAVILFAVLFFVLGFGEVTVTREFESPQMPGGTPQINLTINGSYRELEIREEVSEGLGIIPQDGGAVDEEENVITWELDEERSQVSYLVVTPGASTGDYRFNGTYLYGIKENKVKGDSLMKVRW